MRKSLLLITCCISALMAWANDGIYYVNGNQLMPITETDIRVKKEILTLNRIDDTIQVNVYYEFFNPGSEKEVLVGFEADGGSIPPYDTLPQHPCITNFKVIMNGDSLDYTVTPVDYHYGDNGKYTDPYYIDGRIQGMSLEQYQKELSEVEAPEAICDFVYHFNAKFRPGLNIIQHTYDFVLSYAQVYSEQGYEGFADFFPYILTAANRWANNQIDDFTLIINMGDRTSFHISPTFYYSASQWTFLGKGRTSLNTIKEAKEYVQFHVIQGSVQFHQENFHPKGELRISDLYRDFDFNGYGTSAQNILETAKRRLIPLRLTPYYLKTDKAETPYSKYTPEQRRILKNLPFAYRGYIFKDKTLQDFFESSLWYIPDPDYTADVQQLTPDEQAWVEFWK